MPFTRRSSTTSAFSGKPVPVVARFSVGGANPKVADNGKSQRNMALQFNLPGGEQWLMGNINAPVFGAATPEQFLGRLVMASLAQKKLRAFKVWCHCGEFTLSPSFPGASAGNGLVYQVGAGTGKNV